MSALVLGQTAPLVALAELYDRFVALGGNAFDTARWYDAEPVLGRWLDGRPDRADLVVITKGGHPADGYTRSRIDRTSIANDLAASLEALRSGTVDLYLLHRDDESVPVGAILEWFNGHREAGRVRAFGASNWTTARLTEAAAYAAAHGLEPFASSSPHLSLAVQHAPAWPGAVSAADRASRAWYERSQLPVVAWSSLARGYFAHTPAIEDWSDADMERVYDAPDNRERRRRAGWVARELGRSPTQVALAWVLGQPFPTFAVMGARTSSELEESAAACAIELTPGQRRWLELDDGDRTA